jgi:hypothetical protein
MSANVQCKLCEGANRIAAKRRDGLAHLQSDVELGCVTLRVLG